MNVEQAENATDTAADVPISMERRRWTEQDAEESAAGVESQAMYPAREEVSVLRGEAEERSRRSLSAEIYARLAAALCAAQPISHFPFPFPSARGRAQSVEISKRRSCGCGVEVDRIHGAATVAAEGVDVPTSLADHG